MRKFALSILFALCITSSTKPMECNPCAESALWNIARVLAYTQPIEYGYKTIKYVFNDRSFPRPVIMMELGGINKIFLSLLAMGWGARECLTACGCLLAKAGILSGE